MNRRQFVTKSLAAAVGGLATLEPIFGQGTRPARAEPLLGLNVQPGHAPGAVPLLHHARIRHVRTSWWEWSDRQSWAWYPEFESAGIEVLPLVYGGRESRLVERYDALRRHFGPFPWVQLENEPDAEGTNRRHGERYGAYLRRAAEHIKRVDPGTRICSPGLGWTQPGVHGFLRGMVEEAGGLLDAVSIHIYGHHPYGEPISRWQQVREAWSGELWCTELGQGDLSTRAYHQFREISRAEIDDFQAAAWRIALSEDPNRSGYARIYGFQLGWDDGGFGILNRDGSPRPAYDWLVSR